MALPSRKPDRFLPLLAAAGLSLCFLPAMTACSNLEETEEQTRVEPEKPMLDMRVTLDKKEYRPGEMVVATVEIRNLTADEIGIFQPFVYTKALPPGTPMPANTKFWLARMGAMDVLRRIPIHPKEDDKDYAQPRREQISPGATAKRRFGFVNLTTEKGEFKLQAQYKASFFETGSERNLITAPFITFKVAGEVLVHRDRQGLLLREEAIKLAKAEYGREIKDADAVLIRNDMGLLDWWVTLRKAPQHVVPSEPEAIAYYVSPYRAVVREPATPFVIQDPDPPPEPTRKPARKPAGPQNLQPPQLAAPPPGDAE